MAACAGRGGSIYPCTSVCRQLMQVGLLRLTRLTDVATIDVANVDVNFGHTTTIIVLHEFQRYIERKNEIISTTMLHIILWIQLLNNF